MEAFSRSVFVLPLLVVMATVSAAAEDLIVGESPVVGGNVSGARDRARADAFRKAVETVFDEARAGNPGAGAAAVAALRDAMGQRARRYVRSFRLVEQIEEGGYVRVKVTVDVDRLAVTREVEGVAGVSAQTSGSGVVVMGARPMGDVVARALQGRGVLARQGSGVAPAGQMVVQVAGTDNGVLPVRGTRILAAACELKITIVQASPVRATPGGDTTLHAWGFADDETAARADCRNRAADDGVQKLASHFPVGRADRGDDVVLSLTYGEPDVLALVLAALRRTPGIRSATVVSLRAQGADIRVVTGQRADAVAAALTKTLGDTVQIVPQKATASRIDLDVRRKGVP